jgi:flagellar P-ring protein precursor FlgI
MFKAPPSPPLRPPLRRPAAHGLPHALALTLAIHLLGLTLATRAADRTLSPGHINMTMRVKDVAQISGIDETHLVGFGLVTGLAGDGDKNPVFTVQAVANMLQRLGVQVPQAAIQSKNIAAVMVTAELPSFSKPGSRFDVHVASMGDAKSLTGGELLATPLQAGDGEVYAVAQGSIVLGGFSAGTGGAGGATVQKNHPTVGVVPNGAKVVAELPSTVVHDNMIELVLKEADFTSASRLAEAINAVFTNSCTAIDSTSARVTIPPEYVSHPVDFIARLEPIEVNPDTTARVVVNERTGTIIANSLIRIAPCAISHGNLTISIASSLDVSQPNALSQTGNTIVTPRTDTKVSEGKGTLITLPEMPTVEKVAASLNALGVSPRDMIAIFMNMKRVGALQAELRVN